MKLCVCVDDHLGMMFHQRRQSRDRRIIARIETLTAGQKLWIAPGSSLLFEAARVSLCVDENYLERALSGDWCFAERSGLAAYEEAMEKIVLFKWNKRYPADVYFDIPLAEHGWRCTETEELRGFSHESITMETWER